jgi:hypothetical protein
MNAGDRGADRGLWLLDFLGHTYARLGLKQGGFSLAGWLRH